MFLWENERKRELKRFFSTRCCSCRIELTSIRIIVLWRIKREGKNDSEINPESPLQLSCSFYEKENFKSVLWRKNALGGIFQELRDVKDFKNLFNKNAINLLAWLKCWFLKIILHPLLIRFFSSISFHFLGILFFPHLLATFRGKRS